MTGNDLCGLVYLAKPEPTDSLWHVPNCNIELSRLYLYPQYRGQGIAAQFWDNMKNYCQENDKKAIALWSFQDNLVANKFYQAKQGQILLNCTRDYVGTDVALNIWHWPDINNNLARQAP